ncbi:hypothetical protein LTR56_010568 [Elasticomyces elasticus]|nr:hypothetical protein LTR22_024528 [Elasticomyces elasticus]KAK3642744.1 hypothetical protein LTR56_010568 [Elasticomyces elasticus]KAK4932424.1 hypothetical protein LTR49_001293 [Elasticomyces elasticus]KAK5760125.1 hypothetical protein LTS12_009680 [Elasticomyces elasticus]
MRRANFLLPLGMISATVSAGVVRTSSVDNDSTFGVTTTSMNGTAAPTSYAQDGKTPHHASQFMPDLCTDEWASAHGGANPAACHLCWLGEFRKCYDALDCSYSQRYQFWSCPDPAEKSTALVATATPTPSITTVTTVVSASSTTTTKPSATPVEICEAWSAAWGEEFYIWGGNWNKTMLDQPHGHSMGAPPGKGNGLRAAVGHWGLSRWHFRHLTPSAKYPYDFFARGKTDNYIGVHKCIRHAMKKAGSPSDSCMGDHHKGKYDKHTYEPAG